MSQPIGRTLSILLVEDSPGDSRLMLENFRPAINAGEVVVQVVKTLALAMDAVRSAEFHCVLLDLNLPDGRGIENILTLREMDGKSAVVVLTGNANESMASQALAAGAQDYLVKGEFNTEQLLKLLRRAVQRHRQTYALESYRDQAFFEATHDSLTQLPNAALFVDRAQQQYLSARLRRQVFSLGGISLHGLDQLRARHGTPLVDELIKSLVAAWVTLLREEDTLGRLADGEFALLRQSAQTPSDWAEWFRRCQQQFATATLPSGSEGLLSLRVTVAHNESGAANVAELLESVRDALLETAEIS